MENELDKCPAPEAGEAGPAVPAAGQPKKKSLAKRILKWVLWSVAGLLAFVLLAVLTLPLWINPVATSVAKSLVPKYTGTAFDVKDVELNPYTGKMLISGVELANPEGYSEKDAFKLGKITVDVEMSTLLSKTIHVREVTVESPFASYVFDAEGVNNFDRIVEAVNKKLGPKKEKKKESDETKVVIDKVTVTGVEVVVGKGRFALASLTLTDFGRDDAPAKLEISGVKLVNPPGFEAENAFSLGSLSVEMETGDLGSLPIKVHEVVIDSPYASYVFDEQNVDNFTRLLEPLLAKGGEPEKKEKKAEKAEKSSGAPVTLDRLEVRNLKTDVCNGRFEFASLVVTDFGKPTAALIKLEDVKLVNPEGFPEPNAFSLKSLSIGMETADLSKKPMVFHDIIVDAPYVGVVLKNGGWDDNIRTIFKPLLGRKKEKKENVEVAVEEEAKPEKEGSGVQIDKLQITDAKFQIAWVTIPIPLHKRELTITDIGKESEEGMTAKEVVSEVCDKAIEGMGAAGALVKKVWDAIKSGNGSMADILGPAVLKNLGLDSIKEIGGKSVEKVVEVKDMAVEGAKKAGEKTIEGAKKAGENIAELGSGAADTAKGLFNGMKNFIGGDKKEEKKEEPEPGK